MIAGIGGVLTIGVLGLAFAGAFLAAAGAASARTILIAAALLGLVTALPLGIPAGVLIGGAAVLRSPSKPDEPGDAGRNLLRVSGAHTRAPRQGEV